MLEKTMNRSSRRAAGDAAWTRTCVFCGRTMDADRWTALPLVQVLDRRELEPHVMVRVGRDVEIRRCVCGVLIASFGRAAQL